MIKVSSSHLELVGYNPFDKILRIQFRDGSIYDYQNVPEHVFWNLMNAASHGRYHAAHIKTKYSYVRIW